MRVLILTEDGTAAGFAFASVLRLGAEYSCRGSACVGHIDELAVVNGLYMGGLLAAENLFSLTTADRRRMKPPLYVSAACW